MNTPLLGVQAFLIPDCEKGKFFFASLTDRHFCSVQKVEKIHRIRLEEVLKPQLKF